MYCIECGSPIEATARICGACRFPQPLEEFADVEPSSVAATMSGRVVFDTRNVLNADIWTSAGFVVLSVGRGSPDPITTSTAASAA